MPLIPIDPQLPPNDNSFVGEIRDSILNPSGYWSAGDFAGRPHFLVLNLDAGTPQTRVEISAQSNESTDGLYNPQDFKSDVVNNSSFSYEQVADKQVIKFCLVPEDCTASDPVELLGNRNTSLTDPETGVKHDTLDYCINGGSVQTFTASGFASNLEQFLSELQNELGHVGSSDHSVFGNSAQGAAIRYDANGNDPVTLNPAGKTGIYDFSTTLELILVDRSEDFVAYFLGEGATEPVVLHACGVFEFA